MAGNESLKRVLMGIKEKARGMRKDHLTTRMRPPKKEEPVDEEFKPLEVPDEALADGKESPKEASSDKARETAAIRNLLKRA